MGKPWGHFDKSNKPDTGGQILCESTQVRYLEESDSWDRKHNDSSWPSSWFPFTPIGNQTLPMMYKGLDTIPMVFLILLLTRHPLITLDLCWPFAVPETCQVCLCLKKFSVGILSALNALPQFPLWPTPKLP